MAGSKFPSGLTHRQARIDAKRLSKIENIPLHEALDRIALSNGAPTWAKGIGDSKPHDQNAKSTPLHLHLSIPGPSGAELSLHNVSPVGFIIGRTGAGKTLLLRHIARQALSQGFNVLVVSATAKAKDQVKYAVNKEIYTNSRLQPNDTNISNGEFLVSESNFNHAVLSTLIFNHSDEPCSYSKLVSENPNTLILIDEIWAIKIELPSSIMGLAEVCRSNNTCLIVSTQDIRDIPLVASKPFLEREIGFLVELQRPKLPVDELPDSPTISTGDFYTCYRAMGDLTASGKNQSDLLRTLVLDSLSISEDKDIIQE